MPKRIERPERERAALATKIEADLKMLRRAGRATDCHETHVGDVARCLSFYLENNAYSLGELELATAELVVTDSILRSPADGSPEDLQLKAEAKEAAGPTRADYARMSASDRLEAINLQQFRKQQDAERVDRTREVENNAFDKTKPMTVAERLRAANSFVEKAAPVEAPEPEAVTDTISQLTPAQQIGIQDVWRKLGVDLYGDRPRKKKSAQQLLSEANVAAYEAAKKKAKS